MSTKNNLNTVGSDFDQIKQSLKSYLKANSGLNDVDFEGSAAATLLDVLAYNTFYNNVYLNAATNEAFLDTAVQRSSVVAHASMLGYTPRSFVTSRVDGLIRVTPTETPVSRYISVPAKTIFTTKIENSSYKFQNTSPVLLGLKNGAYEGEATLFEGSIRNYRYTVNIQNKGQKFEIPSSDVDLDILKVGIIRDSNYTEYEKATTITSATATSKLYWVRENDSGRYEVRFGDGVFGEAVVQGDIVVLEYLVSSGAIPNGAAAFEAQTTISGYTNVTFIPSAPAYGGTVSEDMESVRVQATRFFETQNRAVTWGDYETLIAKEFGFIESISVWGGEDNEPPFYGRVFVSAKPKQGLMLTTTEQQTVNDYIKSKNVASIKINFVDPDYVYLGVNSVVKFNYDRSPYDIQTVETMVKDSIVKFVDLRLEKFGVPFKHSNLVSAIDNSVIGIASNETHVRLAKRFTPEITENTRYTVDFKTPVVSGTLSSNGLRTNLRTQYIYLEAGLPDNGDSVAPVSYYFFENGTKYSVDTVLGTIDYATGLISLDFITIFSVEDDFAVQITVDPDNYDYYPKRNQLLTTMETMVSVEVLPEIAR